MMSTRAEMKSLCSASLVVSSTARLKRDSTNCGHAIMAWTAEDVGHVNLGLGNGRGASGAARAGVIGSWVARIVAGPNLSAMEGVSCGACDGRLDTGGRVQSLAGTNVITCRMEGS